MEGVTTAGGCGRPARAPSSPRVRAAQHHPRAISPRGAPWSTRTGARAILARRRLAAVRVHELRHQPLGIEAEVFRVLAHERAREDPAGQDVDAVLLEGLEEADADLRRVRHLAQIDPAQFPFAAEVSHRKKPWSEGPRL
jgi:hypothetical protein